MKQHQNVRQPLLSRRTRLRLRSHLLLHERDLRSLNRRPSPRPNHVLHDFQQRRRASFVEEVLILARGVECSEVVEVLLVRLGEGAGGGSGEDGEDRALLGEREVEVEMGIQFDLVLVRLRGGGGGGEDTCLVSFGDLLTHSE